MPELTQDEKERIYLKLGKGVYDQIVETRIDAEISNAMSCALQGVDNVHHSYKRTDIKWGDGYAVILVASGKPLADAMEEGAKARFFTVREPQPPEERLTQSEKRR